VYRPSLTLRLYFNRTVNIRQDILSIRSQHEQNVSIKHMGAALPDITPTSISSPTNAKQLHRGVNADHPEVSTLSLQENSQQGPITIPLARVARERALMLERYQQQSILVSLAAILPCAAISPMLIRRGLAR
jgi:two-component system, OmpR family, sensor kinase